MTQAQSVMAAGLRRARLAHLQPLSKARSRSFSAWSFWFGVWPISDLMQCAPIVARSLISISSYPIRTTMVREPLPSIRSQDARETLSLL